MMKSHKQATIKPSVTKQTLLQLLVFIRETLKLLLGVCHGCALVVSFDALEEIIWQLLF